MHKLGFGGSCHWCTEAIFQSLKGVIAVEQGWISPVGDNAAYSEAVVVEFDPNIISLAVLVAVHLHTHSCTANHTMRPKYRSAIYTFTPGQAGPAMQAIDALQPEFGQPIITRVLPFAAFKVNKAEYLNYYYANPQKPFCQNIVNPKLKLLTQRFAKQVDAGRLQQI